MYCMSCGGANPDQARFCERCGTTLENQAQSAAAVQDDVQHIPGEEAREAAVRALSAARDAVAAAPPSMFFMSMLVAWVSRGDFFRRFVSTFLRVVAVLTALGGALGVITFAVNGFKYVSGAGEVLTVILILIVTTIAVYMYTHLFWIRSRTITELPESQYSAIPVASILIKLAGEQLAVASVIAGLVGFVVALFAGGYAPYAMGGVGALGYGYNPFVSLFAGGGAFLGALGALLGGVVGAFAVLILAYMLAEAVAVLVDIARDTRSLREANSWTSAR